MRLLYLQLKNYRRFKELELELPNGLVGVIGANGSGKSSLLEAVAWALYGNESDIVRSGKESVKRQGTAHSDPCEVTLEFEMNRSVYRMNRKMTGKALTMSATLLADGKIMATGTRETSEAVQKLLGMDYKAFFISVFAKQKELNTLTTLRPAERRKEILRMLGILDIDDAVKLLREDRKYADAGIKEARRRLYDDDGQERKEHLEAELKELASEQKILAKRKDESDKALKKKDGDIKKSKEEIKDLEKKAKTRNLALRERSSQTATLRSLEKEMSGLRKETAALEELGKEFDDQKASMKKVEKELNGLSNKKEKAREEASDSRSKMGELRSNLQQQKKEITIIDKDMKAISGLGPESECPTCLRKLEGTYERLLASFGEQREILLHKQEKTRKAMGSLEEQLGGIDARTKALDKRERILSEKLMKWEKVKVGMERLEGLLKKVVVLSDTIKVKEKDLAKLESDIKGMKFDEDDFEKKKDQVDTLVEERRTIEKQGSQARERGARLEERSLSIGKEIKQLAAVEKEYRNKAEEFELLDHLDSILAGFKTHMISRIRPGLSQSSSRLIAQLTDSRYNEILLDEDYEISMADEADIHPIERFSGGEKDLANLCLRLAISQIISERAGGGSMDFIILDEIFGSQDTYRRNKIFSALAGLGNRFKQIFLITHVEEVKDMLGNAIIVKRLDDGTSMAEVV